MSTTHQKTWDAIVAGGGVIGLSLALALRKRGATVLVVDRTEPGREASHAAAGMLAHCEPHPAPLHALAEASARMYPEFVHELEDESGMRVDYRAQGTLELLDEGEAPPPLACARLLAEGELARLEPRLAGTWRRAALLAEASLDNRALVAALLKAAKHRGIDVATGFAVNALQVAEGRVHGVRTERTDYHAPVVVNCCGAWAFEIPGVRVPTRPVKGHMLCVVGGHALAHVVRVPKKVYLVPRSDGRLLIGSTLEEAGWDKRVEPDVVQRLHQGAANVLPDVGEMKILEAWTGLRPATPDELPVLGATRIAGYYVATGHFRDGILLAPVTASLMAHLIAGERVDFDLTPFAPARFDT